MNLLKISAIALLCCVPVAVSAAQDESDNDTSRFILLVDDASRLCTSLIARRDLDAAVEACDADVDAASVPITTGRYPHGHSNRRALAIAYSNRAVLNWLLGNLDAASSDLAHALRQNRHTQEIAHNQTVLADRYLASSK